MRYTLALLMMLSSLFIAACEDEARGFLASGTFESEELMVSAETTGKVLALDIEEGQGLASGQEVGRIDCQPLRPDNLDLQLKRCRVVAPQSGTVLVKYAEAGEFVAAGRPLFKLADTQRMVFRAYVTAAQLSSLKVGDQVAVVADFESEGSRRYSGTVTWISSKAEFTPKTIQTREERANQVYAVKVAVENDGFLKLGMYGTIPGEGL